MGPSALVTDKKLFGLDNEKLHPMLNESVEVIVRLLESPEPIDHHGEFWSFEGMRLQLRSYQQPRMPLAIASSGTSGSLELAGRYDMMLLSPAGKNRWRNPAHSEQWKTVEAAAARCGKTASRDNWRIATSVYLAETREQAWADVEAGIARDMQYFFAIGLKRPYESYPDQPALEITPRSAADRRDWIIGTPDDAIRHIERMQQETGGFGGLMLTTHEWTGSHKLRRSLELFARYVMPHFRGHTFGFRDEWDRLRQAMDEGGMQPPENGRPSNLANG